MAFLMMLEDMACVIWEDIPTLFSILLKESFTLLFVIVDVLLFLDI